MDHTISCNLGTRDLLCVEDMSGQKSHLVMLYQKGLLNDTPYPIMSVIVLIHTCHIQISGILYENVSDVQTMVSLINPTLVGLYVQNVDLQKVVSVIDSTIMRFSIPYHQRIVYTIFSKWLLRNMNHPWLLFRSIRPIITS